MTPPARAPHRRRAGLAAAAGVLALGAVLAGPCGDALAQAAAPQPAAADAGGPRWSELGPAQQQVLRPLAADWDSFDARSKERWMGVAARFHKMPPAEQQRANERMVEWSRMSPQERTRARLAYQDLRSVSKEERAASWKAYQALPDDQKQALAQRAAAANASASAASAAGHHAKHPPLEAVQPKTNVVAPLRDTRTPVDPGSAEVQVRPGATTTLVNRRPSPPAHERTGQPKIAAGPKDVDRTTLLPKKGPQAVVGAATPGHPTPQP